MYPIFQTISRTVFFILWPVWLSPGNMVPLIASKIWSTYHAFIIHTWNMAAASNSRIIFFFFIHISISNCLVHSQAHSFHWLSAHVLNTICVLMITGGHHMFSSVFNCLKTARWELSKHRVERNPHHCVPLICVGCTDWVSVEVKVQLRTYGSVINMYGSASWQ